MAGIDLLLSARSALPFRELTDAIAETLHELGFETSIVCDRLPEPRDDRAVLVVAPHDVYPHLEIHDEAALADSLARTILICCERPSAADWTAILPYAAAAGAVLDITEPGVAAFEEHHVLARRFQLGYHERFDCWGGSERLRPIDMLFLGSATPRRTETLAAGAPVFARYDVELRVAEGASTAEQSVQHFIAGQEKYELLADSKLLLSVHRDEELSFEWLRALDALCNGCVLVSEESVGIAPLEPGRHIVTGTRAELPQLADALLREPARLEHIRESAYRLVREQIPLRRSVETVAELAAQLPERSASRPRPLLVPLRPSRVEDQPAAVTRSTAESLEEMTDLVLRQGRVMKRLFFDMRLLRRQIAHLAHTLDDPAGPLVDVVSTPAAESATPDVSVVVTLYNYEGYVRDALESVLRSEGVDIQTIVVDDASIDGSADAVREFMREHPDAPITLLQQRINSGVQRSRNLAFGHARAAYAFVLDADNLVYPHGIRKLRDALERDPEAAFAFGLIERFGSNGSLGLMGTQGWDPARLARGHYIDAMALVRVDSWRRVGGYVTDPTLELGWEDYDLWLSFAVEGLRGAHVREVVGRYRVHDLSSLTITTLDTEDLAAKLRHRHGKFFDAFEENGR